MIEAAGVTIGGVSVGGLETCIELPSWKLCFDLGRCPPTAHRWGRVLFSHAHVDHLGGIPFHAATRDLMGMSVPDYHVPAENVDDLEALLAAWRRLDRSPLPCRVHGASPGDVITVGPGREAQAFRAVHRVPALGWALWSTRKRLLPAFVGLPGPQIAQLRAEGVVIDQAIRTPELAFSGDSTIDIVDREAVVRQARVLILEVTFWDDKVSVEKARGKGHVHVDEVLERADLFANEAIVFTHLSQRHPPEDVRRILDSRFPAHLRERVQVLFPSAGWGAP